MAEERAFHIIKRRERNSMNRQTILLISDMRQVYLAEIMTKRGLNVRCLDIRNSGTVKEQLEKLKSFLAEADMLILPIPVTKIPEQKMLNDILNKNLTNDTLVLGGCFSTEQQELLERRDIHYLDFMRDEIVTEENAVATAGGRDCGACEPQPLITLRRQKLSSPVTAAAAERWLRG